MSRRFVLAAMVLVASGTSAMAGAAEDCVKKSGDAAIAACTAYLSEHPKSAAAYTNRGVAYENKGDYDRAIADYDKALALDPKDAAAYNNRGVAYRHKGDYDRAIADYDKALALDPKDAAAYYNRGIAYKNMGDPDRAIADYDKALALDPKDAAVYRSRGVALFDKGDFKRAAGDFLNATDIRDDAYAMMFRHLARARAGENAASELEANAGRLKTKAWPYAAIELLLGRRRPDATLAAATTPGETCEAHFYIGESLLLTGDTAGAGRSLRTAADTCPKNFDEFEAARAELARLPK